VKMKPLYHYFTRYSSPTGVFNGTNSYKLGQDYV